MSMSHATRAAFMLDGSARYWDELQQDVEVQKQRLQDALAALRAADPEGWERWYLSDACPDFHNWFEIGPTLEAINAHVSLLNSMIGHF